MHIMSCSPLVGLPVIGFTSLNDSNTFDYIYIYI